MEVSLKLLRKNWLGMVLVKVLMLSMFLYLDRVVIGMLKRVLCVCLKF